MTSEAIKEFRTDIMPRLPKKMRAKIETEFERERMESSVRQDLIYTINRPSMGDGRFEPDAVTDPTFAEDFDDD